MRLFAGTITQLASEGRLTLQVPELAIVVSGSSLPIPGIEEYPDDWFCHLRDYVLCTGRERGFLYLTRKGYEANENALRIAFEDAIANGLDRTNGEGWPAFERHAQEHFTRVESRTTREILKHQRKISQLEEQLACV